MTKRREAQDAVIERAMTDPDFRARLLAQPHATLSEFLGVDLPPELNIRVEEEQPGEVMLVLPMASSTPDALADTELAGTAGAGWGPPGGHTSEWTTCMC